MTDFYIKKITASGNGKRDASVEFTGGLNIICGISDTGKSCILLCVDFIFGSNDLPFDKDGTGYSIVKMEVETSGGTVLFERELGRNIITVESTDESIAPGKYDREYKKDSKNKAINEVLLRLIGIKEEHRILYSKDFVKKRLTWRTFSHMFIINEDDVHKKEPILLPSVDKNTTYFLSSLLFLMTGEDYDYLDEREERRIRDTKKNEIIRRINEELEGFSKKKATLTEKLSSCGNSDITGQVHALIDELNAVKEKTEQANERGRQLLGAIMDARQELTDCDFLLDRYHSLRNHFLVDIKRLSLIADGDSLLENIPLPEKCPFCAGDIPEQEKTDYITAARADLSRIITEFDGLQEAEADIKSRRETAEYELTRLEREKADIDAVVAEKLLPKELELKSVLADYKAVTQIQAELDFIGSIVEERTSELRERENASELKIEYKVKDNYKNNKAFTQEIDKYIYDTFDACRFEGLTSAHFSIDKFEVFINGVNKSTSHGKGYRAFINTALALAFRKYLHDTGVYKTGLFVVDSPLLTLKQGVDDQAPESMKTALFRHLLEKQSEGQVIIIENDIPELDYESNGVKPIIFTGGKEAGRYGFLYLDGQY